MHPNIKMPVRQIGSLIHKIKNRPHSIANLLLVEADGRDPSSSYLIQAFFVAVFACIIQYESKHVRPHFWWPQTDSNHQTLGSKPSDSANSSTRNYHYFDELLRNYSSSTRVHSCICLFFCLSNRSSGWFLKAHSCLMVRVRVVETPSPLWKSGILAVIRNPLIIWLERKVSNLQTPLSESGGFTNSPTFHWWLLLESHENIRFFRAA